MATGRTDDIRNIRTRGPGVADSSTPERICSNPESKTCKKYLDTVSCKSPRRKRCVADRRLLNRSSCEDMDVQAIRNPAEQAPTREFGISEVVLLVDNPRLKGLDQALGAA